MTTKPSDKVSRLVEVLGEGEDLKFTSTEIADILWLALERRKKPDDIKLPEPHTVEPEKESNQKTQENTQSSSQKPINQPVAEVIPKKRQQSAKLSSDTLSIQLPDAPIIRHPLDLARALRPLIGQMNDTQEIILDEVATAERTAKENRLPIPVFSSRKKPYFDLVLVVDECESMIFWRGVTDALQQVFKHYGVFRNVIYGQIKPNEDETDFKLYLGKRKRICQPKEFIDAGGHRLILVVSDCVTDYWHNGKMLKVLKLWSKANTMAIIQMLPDWLWLRTGLGLGTVVNFGSLHPLQTSQDLSIEKVLIWTGIDANKGIKVPVISLEPKIVRSWSNVIIGRGDARTVGFVFDDNFIAPNSANSKDLLEPLPPEKRVERFRMSASALARKLASLLAAAPVITLPVVRLVQETLLPLSQTSHIAEVFLGGLLKPITPITPETHPDTVEFRFADEQIRDIFLDAAPSSDSITVLDAVSNYIARRLGKTLKEFAALLRKRQTTQLDGIDLQAFALIQAKVLKRLGGDYARFAQELEQEWQSSDDGDDFGLKWHEVIEEEIEIAIVQILEEDEQTRLSLFESKTVYVDRKGKIIRREPVNAYYYEKSLGENVELLYMIFIPESTFKMGSPKNEKDRYDDESPQHQVNVSAFYMSQTPITQAQWQVIAFLPQERKPLEANPSNFKGDDLPVENITWQDAIEFCARLSRHTGRKYRLPSEAEWEYACRAGTKTPFHFGETITSKLVNYDASQTYQQEEAGENRGQTTPVRSFPPNAFGLYDMHGNVWEWCLDPWHENYEGAPQDGSVWDKVGKNDNRYLDILNNINVLLQDERSHIVRGGSWDVDPRDCRSAYRYFDVGLSDNVGFRVVCAP